MTSLVLAAVFFVGTHLALARPPLRGPIAGRIGEKGFQGLYSVISVIGIVWMCRAWARAETVELWAQPASFVPVALILMLIGLLLVGLGLTTPSPTALGRESLLEQEDPAQGVLRITRHPFLWGVALFSLTHLILSGELASLVFFGSLVVLSLVGSLGIDAKRSSRYGESWSRFAAVTSNVPFVAIVQGRNSLALGELGWWRIGVGVVLFLVVMGLHLWLGALS